MDNIKHKSKLPIDLCLEKGIITKDEHYAALTLRKLYYLFFGDRILKSNSPSISSKKSLVLSIKSESKAYSALLTILKRLREKNFYQSILDLCIFDIEPSFLQTPKDMNVHHQLSHFKEGIEDLCKTLTC